MSSDGLGRVRVDQMADGETRRFPFRDALGLVDEAIVLRLGDDFHVYVNRCPHWKTALDSASGDFYDRRGGVLVCERHGARFDPRNGECTSGPAEGKLERIPYRREGHSLVVEPPDRDWID